MEEINQSRISMSIHLVAAIAIGWVSVLIAAMSRSIVAAAVGLIVLYLVGMATQRVTKQKGIKWWAANGIVIYLFVWFISWTLFFNLALA